MKYNVFNMNIRKFIISGGLFTGFETMVNLDFVDSNAEIIVNVITQLHKSIERLPELCRQLIEERAKYHIHSVEFGEILISETTRSFYICNHCSVEQQNEKVNDEVMIEEEEQQSQEQLT